MAKIIQFKFTPRNKEEVIELFKKRTDLKKKITEAKIGKNKSRFAFKTSQKKEQLLREKLDNLQ